MSKKSYLELTEAAIKGDNAKDIAAKNQKIMSATISAQIALKTAERVKLGQAEENAKEEVEKSLVCTSVIGDADNVLQVFLDAKTNLARAEKALQDHDKTVEWLQEAKEMVG